MMTTRHHLSQSSFERLANMRGDITQPVLDLYFARHDKAQGSFSFHSPHAAHALQAEMVECSIFFLMQWAENPAAAKFEYSASIARHVETLAVGPNWYFGLIDAVLGVLMPSIPDDAQEERALWLSIREEIMIFFDQTIEDWDIGEELIKPTLPKTPLANPA